MLALQEATLEIFGHSGPALDLAGSTDLGIVAEVLELAQDRIVAESVLGQRVVECVMEAA
jgi:hypothetical protein